jgi:pyruvate kinase
VSAPLPLVTGFKVHCIPEPSVSWGHLLASLTACVGTVGASRYYSCGVPPEISHVVCSADMVEVGDHIYIGRYLVTGADEASLYLEVKSRTSKDITCVALNDAKLDGLLTVYHMERDDKGIKNKPNTQALFSPSDLEAIKAIAAEFDIDFLSLSYTRHAHDVHEARHVLDEMGLNTCKIIGKLDAKQSLVNFRGILNAADGIMLSRGNLGLDCLPEKIAVIQKNVTTSCNLVGKPCVVTRIVDSMVNAPRPTRAEATDVANAVLDGADCLMLGAETLRGIDPANAVKTVVQCCQAAEAEFNHTQHFDYLIREAMKAENVGIMVPGVSMLALKSRNPARRPARRA